MSVVALSELLGAAVRDASGAVRGRVRDIAVAPQDHPTRIAYLIVRTSEGERIVPHDAVKSAGASVRATTDASLWEKFSPTDGVLLLKRDLLDQQIIDIHGRKVVRVNDVELESTPINSHLLLNVVSVDVGARGAIRRLSKGIVPSFTLRALLERIPPRVIPWRGGLRHRDGARDKQSPDRAGAEGAPRRLRCANRRARAWAVAPGRSAHPSSGWASPTP